jgi:hypothetical protein
MVILLNLESLYESLYDALNQVRFFGIYKYLGGWVFGWVGWWVGELVGGWVSWWVCGFVGWWMRVRSRFKT